MKVAPKLRRLAEIEGYADDVLPMLEAAVSDSICPSICMNEGCDYTADLEPDQREGYCEECHTNTMKSALVIAGFI